MDDLEQKYTEQHGLYEEAVAAAIANPQTADMNKIMAMNASLSKILHDMIETLTNAKSESGGLVVYRDELIARLRKIQEEYSGMAANADKLETLRRIREAEETRANGSFGLYFLGLISAMIVLIIMIIWKGAPTLKVPTMQLPSVLPTSPLL